MSADAPKSLESLKAEIEADVRSLVELDRATFPNSLDAFSPRRTFSLTDPFERELYTVLERGTRELAKVAAAQAAGRREGGRILRPAERLTIINQIYPFISDLWLNTGCDFAKSVRGVVLGGEPTLRPLREILETTLMDFSPTCEHGDNSGPHSEDGVPAPAPSVAKRAIRSVSVPVGTAWKDLRLLIHDDHVDVMLGGRQVDTRSYEHAGFGKRDQRLTLLRLFANSRGKLPSDKPVRKGKTPLKTWVSRLRCQLQTLIPIDGDPIEHHKKAAMYVCQFEATSDDDAGVLIPAESWLATHFHERADGCVAVQWEAKIEVRVQGTPKEDEVAADTAPVTHVYSLERLQLQTAVGKLTREGQVFVALLRGNGRLQRPPGDTAVLQLAAKIQGWTRLSDSPMQYSLKVGIWTALFECSSDLKLAK